MAARRRGVRSHATGRDKKTGVPVHAVIGADCKAIQVPRSKHQLLGPRFHPAIARPHFLDYPGHLGGRGDVDHERSPRLEDVISAGEAFPGSQHVENDGIDGLR
jgi:hypothetical protein